MTMVQVTELLEECSAGKANAETELYRAVLAEMRLMAQQRLRKEPTDVLLQPTALIDDVWMKLAPSTQRYANRRHFFRAASQAMREILIDNARRRNSQRRSAGQKNLELFDVAEDRDDELIRLHEAIQELWKKSPAAAEVVDMRRFGYRSHEQIAEYLGTTVSAVRDRWEYGVSWLRAYMSDSSD